MPAPRKQQDARRGQPPEPRRGQQEARGQLVHGLLWAGVGLAPLALLVLLFGSSTGALRVAVILATLAIAMIAVSVALRPSVEMLRVDIEEKVLDEVDVIRARAREDVSLAARNTHRALTEQIQELGETMEDMRNQIIELQAQQMLVEQQQLTAGSAGAPGPGGPGVVRRTETVHVTRRTTMVGGDEDRTGTVYGTRPPPAPGAVEGEWRERPDERQWDGAAGDRYAAVRADEHGREFRVGERRASVRSDDHGSELRVEDRWASLRRDDDDRYDRRGDARPPDARPEGRPRADGYGEADWEETFRSLSAKQTPAITTGRDNRDGLDEWSHSDWTKLGARSEERDRGYDRPRDDRRYDEDRRSDDRGRDDRGRDDRVRDDRARDDRGRDDRGRDDRGYGDRGRGRDDRYDDRGYGDRGRGRDDRYDDRGPDGYDDRGRDDRGRGRDDRYDDRGRDDRPYPPRQRGPHHSEYDR